MSAIESDIDLTDEEQSILATLILRVEDLRGDHMKYQVNAAAVLKLFRLLTARGAIPAHRLNWFADPEFGSARRGKSLKDVFERNGSVGDDLITSPHFLVVMRYFLCGPDLNKEIKQAFAEAVQNAGGEITSSAIVDVGNAARALTRRFGLQPHDAAEEFHKLAYEHGAHPMWANRLHERVRTLRT